MSEEPQQFVAVLPLSDAAWEDELFRESMKEEAVRTWHWRLEHAGGAATGEPEVLEIHAAVVTIDGEEHKLSTYTDPDTGQLVTLPSHGYRTIGLAVPPEPKP